MPYYNIIVTRDITESTVVPVEADSPGQAGDKALKEASKYRFTEDDVYRGVYLGDPNVAEFEVSEDEYRERIEALRNGADMQEFVASFLPKLDWRWSDAAQGREVATTPFGSYEIDELRGGFHVSFRPPGAKARIVEGGPWPTAGDAKFAAEGDWLVNLAASVSPPRFDEPADNDEPDNGPHP